MGLPLNYPSNLILSRVHSIPNSTYGLESMTDFKALSEYCLTDRQREVFAYLVVNQNQKTTAEALGVTRQTIGDIVNSVKKAAIRRLHSPEHGLNHPVPPGFTGDFTLQRGPDGVIERTWMKGKLDRARAEAMYLQFIEGLSENIKPARRTRSPAAATDMIASAILFGDAHIGILASALETMGMDTDLPTITQDLRNAIDYLVNAAPASKRGYFINLGDFLHIDGTEGTTHKGTTQDTSATFNCIMRAAGATMRYSIDKMLTKFPEVHVINARGNHDNDAAFALNMYLEGVYEDEPRVTVFGNDAKFNFIEFGQCLIGVSHGDKINNHKLCGVMTRQAAQAWGRTTFRRWWLGHVHHKLVEEHESGITLERFHTLAPIDRWHSDNGYGAEQRITMITLHQEFGEVNRMAPSLAMIRALTS